MKKFAVSILAALSLLTGLGGALDKTEGELGIGKKADVTLVDSRNDPRSSGSPLVEFVFSGAFAAAAGLMARNGTAKGARFDVERIVRRGDQRDLSEHEIANAFNKSEDGMRQLILYVCNDLGFGKTNIERVNLVYDAKELIVSIRGFVQDDNQAKLAKLKELVLKIVLEKIDRAAKIQSAGVSAFDEAVRRAVEEQVAEGREKLMETLRLFNP